MIEACQKVYVSHKSKIMKSALSGIASKIVGKNFKNRVVNSYDA